MLKIALAIGSTVFAIGATIVVMALLDGGRAWALDERLCAIGNGGAFIALAVLWFAVLWFGLGRIHKPAAVEKVVEAEDTTEEIDETVAETEPPVIKANSRQMKFDSSIGFKWNED
jgi:hypothetical protein